MNKEKFTSLLKSPTNIDALKTIQLEEVIREFPYFQPARVLHLKGLNTLNSFKYNQELKRTAAHTIDRAVLFDFITSNNFTKSFNEIHILEEIEVIDPETVEILHQKIKESFSEEAALETEESKDTLKIEAEETEEEVSEILEIGKPIEFSSNEPHSFNEWMQLISKKPIDRVENKEISSKKPSKTEEKFDLISKFIKTNPKIAPVDKTIVNQDVAQNSYAENDSLMTETLAKVYLEQKKYENAIKAYRILSLKYPEKSGFFADRIKAIKNLQKNKS